MWLLPILAHLASAEETCSGWGFEARPAIETGAVQESSGLAVSRGNGHLYTLEDAGNAAALHVFSPEGAYLGPQNVRGATNTDWEDLSDGPCPEGVAGEGCLWIADIGDNDETREEVSLWVVPASTEASVDALRCRLAYADGRARDAETLLVFPGQNVRVVTKENDDQAHVFVAGPLRCDGSVEPLFEEAELDVPEPITGGAVSPDGTSVWLRGPSLGLLWRGCALDWTRAPEEIPLPESEQGEAIAMRADDGLVVSSEGAPFRAWVATCTERSEAVCADQACGGCASGKGPAESALGLLVIAWAYGSALRRTRSDGRR